MKNKQRAKLIGLVLCILPQLLSCGSSPEGSKNNITASPAVSRPDDLSIDDGIRAAAKTLAAGIPEGRTVSINITSETGELSGYVNVELHKHLANSGKKFELIDRRNTALVAEELRYQAGNNVDKNSAGRVGIGHESASQTTINGKLNSFGDGWRLEISAVDNRTSASEGTWAEQVSLPRHLIPKQDLDTEIERAMSRLGRNIPTRRDIYIGKIGYAELGGVSAFSQYLQNKIYLFADEMDDKFRVSINETGTDGHLEGSFLVVGQNVQVTLTLCSDVDNARLGSSEFIVPDSELKRLKIELLPPGKTLSEMERIAKMISEYNGKNNQFKFTINSDKPNATYHDGDFINFKIYSEKDCWFKVTHIDKDMLMQDIFPADGEDDNFIKGGTTRLIPGENRFQLTKPYGEEFVLIAAYEKQFVIEYGPDQQASSTALTKGLKDIKPKGGSTYTSLPPVATAQFTYSLLENK